MTWVYKKDVCNKKYSQFPFVSLWIYIYIYVYIYMYTDSEKIRLICFSFIAYQPF